MRTPAAHTAIVALIACSFMPAAAFAAEPPPTVRVQPGKRYGAGWFQRLFLGSQWRELWTTTIEVPVLDLDTFDGGLFPEREGGGLQTKSLRFKSSAGRNWQFRSVDKDPTRILSEDVRQSLLGNLAQDLTSTTHPGAALVVPPFLDAAGILHATPFLAVLGDDQRLGEFRAAFAGMLGMVELRDEKNLPGVDKVFTTWQLFARLEERSDERVDARAYLRARLIDIFIGDWDRHVDQWRWARVTVDGQRLWQPIPRDRDQAFARFNGILPSIMEYYTKQLAGFGSGYPSIDKLTFSGRYTDRRFLIELGKPEWDAIAAEVTAKLTDAVIADAVRRLPVEMYKTGGAELEQALRARRDELPRASEDFYRLLADRVDVRGTESADDAEIASRPDGSVDVSLFARDEKTGDRLGPAFFHRAFNPEETSELRLYMLGGPDRVHVDDAAAQKIKVRLIPEAPDARLSPKDRFETTRDWGRDLLFFPILSYDSTRGLVVGTIAVLTHFGFGRAPYADLMTFSAAWSTGTNQPRIGYTAEFRTRSTVRLLLSADYSGFDQVNFFGFGNETVRNVALANQNFYRVLRKQVTVHPLIDVQVIGPLRSSAGALFKYLSSEANAPIAIATGAPGFAETTIAGAQIGLGLSTRSGSLAAERGFRVHGFARYYPSLFGNHHDFTKLRGEASGFAAAHLLTDIALGVRISGEKNFGTYPYFEAAFIGGIPAVAGLEPATSGGNLLRGYDLNRYAGDASLVANTELRAALGSWNSVLPMRYGLLALADIGRVFFAPQPSSRWHSGVGGGVWLALVLGVSTFELSTAVTATIVRSGEGTSFYFASGFGF